MAAKLLKMTNISKSFGSNKVLDGIDSEKLGKKFASKLNKIFTFGYSFLKTTDFSKIGGGVASFLNNALDDLNTYQIGQTLARKWTASV